ncbi:MAG: hypothetical protein D3910_18000 [Candidatus Electrothrix sp. ATG2]|nr:hypothetical protein [Candidatus Electrothrix sp. ATG2]
MKEKNKREFWYELLTSSIATTCLVLGGIFFLQQGSYGEAHASSDSGTASQGDMSSFMVLGDSIPFGYMAGYRGEDGETIPQVDPRLVPHAWPKLVAEQAGVAMHLPYYAFYPDNLSVPGYTLNECRNHAILLIA